MPERRRDVLVVLVVALVARLGVVAWAHGRFPAAADGHYFDVLARRLAGGHGYTWLWPDGAVTYVAHYPVGYPAMLGALYAVFGASETVAMTLNAVLGAASACAAHRLVDFAGTARWRPLAAGIAVALHPALALYTPALMTEGVTAALLVLAAATANHARRASGASWTWLTAAGAIMGLATLVRPQSLVLAPVLGALAVDADAPWRTGVRRAFGVGAVALACVLPWTGRNCVRMHHCALVSVNAGWNLLIGAETTDGSWREIGPNDVPRECATEWAEAAKDECFGRAAKRQIARAPWAWLARAPSKVAVTFDYFGAAPWYLHASNAAAFGDRSKAAWGATETAVARVLLLAALLACGGREGPRPRVRRWVALIGATAAVTEHGWIGYAAVVACVILRGYRAAMSEPLVVPFATALIAATAGIHAVFFGAGRYGLVVTPFVTALAFVSAPRFGKESPTRNTGSLPPREADPSGCKGVLEELGQQAVALPGRRHP